MDPIEALEASLSCSDDTRATVITSSGTKEATSQFPSRVTSHIVRLPMFQQRLAQKQSETPETVPILSKRENGETARCSVERASCERSVPESLTQKFTSSEATRIQKNEMTGSKRREQSDHHHTKRQGGRAASQRSRHDKKHRQNVSKSGCSRHSSKRHRHDDTRRTLTPESDLDPLTRMVLKHEAVIQQHSVSFTRNATRRFY